MGKYHLGACSNCFGRAPFVIYLLQESQIFRCLRLLVSHAIATILAPFVVVSTERTHCAGVRFVEYYLAEVESMKRLLKGNAKARRHTT